MAGVNPKASSHNPPSSSNSHRKSRWESNHKPPADPNPSAAAAGDSKQPKPSPHPKENPALPSPPPPNRGTPGNPNPHPGPVPHSLPGPVPFPDAPPPPTYGFHMLDRRTIALADGSVRTYFALPPDYRDFSPPVRPIDHAGRLLRLRHGGHVPGPEPGGWGFDNRFAPGGGFSPEGFRDRDGPIGRGRPQDYWNSLGLDGRGPGEGSLKRKFGGDDEDGRGKDEFLRQNQQQQQLSQNGKPGVMPNGFPFGVGGRGDYLAGTSGPHTQDVVDPSSGDELRSSKFMRIGEGLDNVGLKHHNVDQVALRRAFLYFAKLINENASTRKVYLGDGKQGRLRCVACGRSSKDFSDMHGLILHTYNSDNAALLTDHLGLHKALCVLMGWNYLKYPDNSKGYQFLPADEVARNQDNLIMWPPMVIIHNTITGKGKDGRPDGLGNKAMDSRLRDLGFGTGKCKSLYSRDGHLGITLVKFSSDLHGLKVAERLSEYFEKENHGRKGWARVQSTSLGKDDEKNPDLVQVDPRTREVKRILYGYLGTASDLDTVDFETRKKVLIESRQDLKPA